jgi:glycosyltransferase involved in cell wall biosynthesis
MRLLWVVPRFGPGVVGGAETHVRALIRRALPEEWTVDVATTCAVDHATWANELPVGAHVDDGVRVVRFPVGFRDATRYDQLHPRILGGQASYAEELAWLAASVWSPELGEFLEDEASVYDLIIFTPYLFGTTVWGAQIAPGRSALMPCLHDEAYARLTTIRKVFGAVRGCLFNSPPEERLARRLYDVADGGLVGIGFDPPSGSPRVEFRAPRGLGPYVLYVGRLEEGKRVHVAVEYAVRYAAERPHGPRLVLAGSGPYRIPRFARDVVSEVGYLDGEELRAAYAEALAFVHPSHHESLSLVLLEAWLEGTPALVAADSEVLREHCRLSGGGFTFGSYEDYRDALDRLLADPALCSQLGAAGRGYVLSTCAWSDVRERFRTVLERLAP